MNVWITAWFMEKDSSLFILISRIFLDQTLLVLHILTIFKLLELSGESSVAVEIKYWRLDIVRGDLT